MEIILSDGSLGVSYCVWLSLINLLLYMFLSMLMVLLHFYIACHKSRFCLSSFGFTSCHNFLSTYYVIYSLFIVHVLEVDGLHS
jgi:hypothetical protein